MPPASRSRTLAPTQVVVMTHAYGDCTGVRYLTNGLKVWGPGPLSQLSYGRGGT
jgi:hypothetical protein